METEIICDHCGEEIYTGEGCYCMDGQIICIDCAADFARGLMRPYWVGGVYGG